MKKTYQAPVTELSMIEPLEVIAATVSSIMCDELGIDYCGGSSGNARASQNHLWDDEEEGGNNLWDEL